MRLLRPLRRFAFLPIAFFTGVLFAASPVVASAQTAGVRVGASLEPDQFFLGGHFETPPLADRVFFRPNVEIGFGQDVTVTTLNFELVYKFPTQKTWSMYAGAGPAMVLIKTDQDDHTEGGFNVLFGAQHQGGLFGEIKAGAIDSPNFKVTVGYTFHR